MPVIDFPLIALSLLAWLFVVTIVITVHELGHFWAARMCRVKIERFSLGFGPTLFARTSKKTGVEWRLAALPVGGYVKFAGDANAAGVPDAEDLAELKDRIIEAYGPGAERNYYHFKPVWQRAFIAAAGPLSNFVLAVVIFAVLFSAIGVMVVPARVMKVEPHSVAEAAGFQRGDLILKIGSETIADQQDAIRIIAFNAGTPLDITVERDKRQLVLHATPKRTVVDDKIAGRQKIGRIGMLLGAAPGEVRYVRYGPVDAVQQGFSQTWKVLSGTLTYLGRIFTGKESGDQLRGPIGTASVAGNLAAEAAKTEGGLGLKAANILLQLVQLVALMSVGIGFLNLLPIPVLDGGHLLFYAYESVARKPLAARVQEVGYQVGLALVVGLMLFATWNDLQKLLLGGLSS